MNLMLITPEEALDGLPPSDARARHLLKTVHAGIGSTLHVGVRGGRRGIATVLTLAPRLTFAIRWESAPQAPLPIEILVGLPRPQTSRKVLHDLASLGARKITFFKPAKGDPAYATSSLWTTDEWREQVEKGAEQACSAVMPEVAHAASLEAALAALPRGGWRVALDPYEAEGALRGKATAPAPALLAIGPERGWDAAERAALRAAGFGLRHLGDRVLRVEAACLVGGALMLAGMDCWKAHQPVT